uniref:Uncharacterized protein n=1 Tax=Cucumis melo TaxID=3656 RepID=A0A9I9E1P1_CUCME
MMTREEKNRSEEHLTSSLMAESGWVGLPFQIDCSSNHCKVFYRANGGAEVSLRSSTSSRINHFRSEILNHR